MRIHTQIGRILHIYIHTYPYTCIHTHRFQESQTYIRQAFEACNKLAPLVLCILVVSSIPGEDSITTHHKNTEKRVQKFKFGSLNDSKRRVDDHTAEVTNSRESSGNLAPNSREFLGFFEEGAAQGKSTESGQIVSNKSGQIESGQKESGQIESGQIVSNRSGQIVSNKSGQTESGQIVLVLGGIEGREACACMELHARVLRALGVYDESVLAFK